MPSSYVPVFPHERWALYLNGGKVTKHLKGKISTQIHGIDCEKYIRNRFTLTSAQMCSIEWEGIAAALRGVSTGDRTRITKYMYKWLPSMEFLHVQGRVPDPLCPLCNYHESNDHLWRCNRTAASRETRWNCLIQCARVSSTEPHLLFEIDRAGREMLQLPPPLAINKNHPLPLHIQEYLCHALECQNDIGWDLFMRGFLHESWSVVQDWFSKAAPRTSPRPTGEQWLRVITRALWDFGLGCWTERNRMVHGPKGGDQLSRDRDKAVLAVQALYDTPPRLLARFRSDYARSFDHRALEPTQALWSWVRRVQTHANITDQWYANERRQYKDIRTFFQCRSAS